MFNRAGKILEEARLCSTSASAGRITFDEEELALTRQEQMAPLEETPPSAGPADGTCARTLHATKSIGSASGSALKDFFLKIFFSLSLFFHLMLNNFSHTLLLNVFFMSSNGGMRVNIACFPHGHL